MNKSNKDVFAKDLKEKFSKAQTTIFADYKGLKATKADELRKALRAENCEVKVLKNNLARVIAKDGSLGADYTAVADSLVGPTLVAFAYGDSAATAKIISKFAQENDALKIKVGLLNQKKLTAADIETLAKLPSREVLIAQLLGTMMNPVRNFVGVLAAVPRGFVTVLDAIEKKRSGSEG
jgi:large subunit ribosomal protein L10